MVDLQSRIERARQLRAEGYNCAQCVLMVFDDVTGVDNALMERFTGGLGTGVSGMREICGAVTAFAIINSLTGYGSPADRKAVYDSVKVDAAKFREMNGSVVCRELRVPGAKPCMDLIIDSITILHNRLTEEQ